MNILFFQTMHWPFSTPIPPVIASSVHLVETSSRATICRCLPSAGVPSLPFLACHNATFALQQCYTPQRSKPMMSLTIQVPDTLVSKDTHELETLARHEPPAKASGLSLPRRGETCGSMTSALRPMLIAAFTSAFAANEHDVQTKASCVLRLALSICPHCEHSRDVLRGSTSTTGTPARRALY